MAEPAPGAAAVSGTRRGLLCQALLLWALAGPLPAMALELGGRVQVEAAHLQGRFTDDGRARSANYLRRAELDLAAALAPPLEAGVTVAFDDEGRATVDEAALTWWPGGRPRSGLSLRMGRFDPDFGLDPSTSSNWTLALERSPIFDLAPDVASGADGLGLRADHAGRRHAASATLMLGEQRSQAVARAVWLRPGPGAVWQLGGSVALGSDLADDGRLRSRLGMRAVTEADGGRRSTLARALARGERYGRDATWAVEAAWQQGRASAQAEWLQRRLEGATRGAPARQAQGHTLTLAWVLHGAPRRHDARRARFGRPAGTADGAGQIEAFVRHDRLRATGGGQARVTTLGLAWTANERWRLAVNTVEARATDANSAGQLDGRATALRLQAVF